MPQTLNDVNRARALRVLKAHRGEGADCPCGFVGDHDEHLAAVLVDALEGPSMSESEPIMEWGAGDTGPHVVGFVHRDYPTSLPGVLYLDDDGTVRSKDAHDA
jgi:hypothetical protein